jgi:flavin-dependent dehydrogenase
MSDTDVFVCGGGPAGLATALAARRKGFAVTVADSLRPPIDKACGEGLLPDAVSAAAQLGVTIPLDQSFPFRGIRFLGKGVSATADFRSGAGLAVRRTVLHQALVEQAERAGVKLLWGTPVTALDQIRARWIVGADGERSRVRAWSGLDASSPRRVRYGFRRHHRVAPWCDYVEVYWGAGLQIYVGPEAADQVCVTSLASDPHVRVDDALQQFPELQDRLQGSEIVSAERGAVTATRKLREVFRGSVALVGDASGSVDAVTGAGVGLAFQQALALADAFEHDSLTEYQRAHRRIMRRRRVVADLLLAMDRWPHAGARARHALSLGPWLFEQLLALHAE